MWNIRLVYCCLLFTSLKVQAQHDHAQHTESTVKSVDSVHMRHEPDSSHTTMQHSDMSSSLSPSLPMSRNGSGTSWNPDNTPVYGYMLHKKAWMLMFMGNVFVRYNTQDIGNAGNRGASQWDAPNMLMAMAQRKVGKRGLFHANLMLSADALIAGGKGYPLLFQTGESWRDQPLVDRQHPHDLFSELSVSYAYSFSSKSEAYVYLGYPGEPALGPVTFMHRPLGNFVPDAPIGHHWEDATHITFGVTTLGYRYGKVKVEGSVFTGREPDENRYDFDVPRMGSWSGRVSFNPNAHWAVQLSHAYLKSPEVHHVTEDVNRTTGSVSYVYRPMKDKILSLTGVLGRNAIAKENASYAALVEGILKLRKLATYVKWETVQKSGEELNLIYYPFGSHVLYAAQAATAGISYDVLSMAGAVAAVGGQLSLSFPDHVLKALYGDTPVSGEVYIHIYPCLLQ
jgi:hypothetical protein